MDVLSSPTGSSPSNGWVACTTDDILAEKPQLFDTLITLPPTHSAHAKEKVWPTIRPSSTSGPAIADIKATQRDLRRYRTLRRELRCFAQSPYLSKASPNGATTKQTHSSENIFESYPNDSNDDDSDDAYSTHSAQVAEPQSWSALAYNSFMWWASAGENRTDMDEEEEGDAALLLRRHPRAESPGKTRLSKSPGGRVAGGAGGGGGSMMMDSEDIGEGRGMTPGGGGRGASGISVEMSVIAYFHHFTALILKTLADVVDAADMDDLDVEPADVDAHVPPDDDLDDDTRGATTITPRRVTAAPTATSALDPPSDGGDTANISNDQAATTSENVSGEEEIEPLFETTASAEVIVESEDMLRMGLDVWSESDRDFVRDLVGLYWGRRCSVRGGRGDVCGVRLC